MGMGGMGMNQGMGGGMGMGGGNMGMGMGMGAGMGMGSNLAYKNRNWAGHQMRHYNLSYDSVEGKAFMVFDRFDRNGSGTLDMREVPQAINYVFQEEGLGYPDEDDIYFCMDEFDKNGDGRLNRAEFKRMLHYLCGHN